MNSKNFKTKIVVSIFSLFLTISSLKAQNIQSLLSEVSNKVKSYENIQIDFKYSLENTRENVKQDTRANITLKGDNYVLNMLGVTRIFDGKTIYTIVPEDEEVTISNYSKEDDKSISVSEMLTFYENGYNYKMDIQQNIRGRKIQFIKLSPIDSTTEIKNILLGIDMQTKHIYKLIQIDSSGTSYTITVNSFKTNQPISQNLFIFDKEKYINQGYYINKLE
ncbi:MAG: outer membrane lipoprotein carrier protein LolA [Flavobacteriaceae bacterium]|nr:outer membrane lipoprotein carrier protein LolA [Flavobacteriaceae bacterium]|tara:strand:+ start:81 stop:743 length:663 start_codon:yes stop_codon:yes gene_type:complete